MFALFDRTTSIREPRFSSLSAAVTSAIAYGAGMENARITARIEHGMIRLEGTAPTLAVADLAVEIATEVAGCHVHSDITMNRH